MRAKICLKKKNIKEYRLKTKVKITYHKNIQSVIY